MSRRHVVGGSRGGRDCARSRGCECCRVPLSPLVRREREPRQPSPPRERALGLGDATAVVCLSLHTRGLRAATTAGLCPRDRAQSLSSSASPDNMSSQDREREGTGSDDRRRISRVFGRVREKIWKGRDPREILAKSENLEREGTSRDFGKVRKFGKGGNVARFWQSPKIWKGRERHEFWQRLP